MLILPPDEPPEQESIWDVRVTLGDYAYRIVLRWNERTESWYLDLFDSDDQPLLQGKRLAINWPITWRYKGATWPAGNLMLWCEEGSNAECGYDDLGHRCKLVYIEPADVPEPADTSIPYTVT